MTQKIDKKDFTTTFLVDQTPRDVFHAVTNVRGWWSEDIEGATSQLNDEFVYHYKDIHSCKMKLIEVLPDKSVVWLVTYNHFNFVKNQNEIATWQEQLNLRPDLTAKTIALYTQDARRFATWLQQDPPGLKATEVTSANAKAYRDHLLAKRYAPTTINRARISLMLFFDTIAEINPFRHLTMIKIVEPAPVALSKTEWNAVRRCA